MNDLPQILFGNIVEFVDAKTLPFLKQTCRNSSSCFNGNGNGDRWKKIYDQYSEKNKLRMIKCNSICITALTIREYKLAHVCFICECTGNNVWFNVFYDMLICKRCEEHSFFKTSGFKTACKEYFLDPELYKDNENIFKVSHGNNFRVLDKTVRKVAESVYTKDRLDYMIDKRRKKRLRMNLNKHEGPQKRFRKFTEEYTKEIGMYPLRVDNELMDIDTASNVAEKYNVIGYIYDDMMCHKIESNTSPTKSAEMLRDFSWMITYMRKNQILDCIYELNASYITQVDPYYVFLSHIRNKEHFYETIHNFVDANKDFNERVFHMNKYMNHNFPKINRSMRIKLSLYSCTEDGVDVDETLFGDFIISGVGNPVIIARAKRRQVFLNANGYMQRFSENVANGVHVRRAHVLAYKSTLAISHGFQPMYRVCTIDLPTVPVNPEEIPV